MKKVYTILIFILSSVLLTTGTAHSQVPDGFNYQGVARDDSGDPITDYPITVRVAILSQTAPEVVEWEEEHDVTTTSFGLFTIMIGDPDATGLGGLANSIGEIDWAGKTLYMRTKIRYNSTWYDMEAARILAVPYALLAKDVQNSALQINADTVFRVEGSLALGTDSPQGAKLAVVSTDDASEDALFEVRRQDGQPVFSVYNTGVKVFVDDIGTKGPKGGFAIGGFGEAKGYQDYLIISPDSIRMFIENNQTFPKGPGSKGGFAIGGFDAAKKGVESLYFNVSGKSVADTYDSSPQILWYPLKEALLAGRVHIGSADSVGLNSTALGYHSIAMGGFSQAFGYRSMALAQNTTAIGNRATASGTDSYAFGSGAKAVGDLSFAFGSVGLDTLGNPTGIATLAEGSYSLAMGMGAQATGTGAMALGVNSVSEGYASTSLGYSSRALDSYSVAIGYNSVADNVYAHSFGLKAVATGRGSLALGMYASASGDYSSSMGYRSRALFPYSVAIGFDTRAENDYASAFGRAAIASGPSSVAVGYSTLASGTNSAAFGHTAEAGGESSLSMGYSSNASQKYSVAIGYNAGATAPSATAIGYESSATGSLATAIGFQALATGSESYAFGSNAQALNTKAFAMGVGTTADADYAVAIGNGSTASGAYSTSVGYETSALGEKAIAIGAYYNYTYYRFVYNPLTRRFELVPTLVTRHNTANGSYSIALGNGNTSYDGGLAVGTYNTARKIGSVAIGHTNYADSAYSFAAGYNNYSQALYAFTLGHGLQAQSVNSFIVGRYNALGGTRDEWVGTEPLFIVGNGESSGARSNAFTVLKNGDAIVSGNLHVDEGTLFIDAELNRIGIGSVAPEYTLDVSGMMRATSNITGGAFITGDWEFDHWTDKVTLKSYMRLDYLADPKLLIQTNGYIYAPYAYDTPVGAKFRSLIIDDTGLIGFEVSSRKYKENIKSYNDVGWLYELNPVTYTYKNDDSNTLQVGLIAEEVEKVNPMFVSYNEKGEPETVTYGSLVTPLLKAVQNQKKTSMENLQLINMLSSENNELRQQNDELRSRLDQLEAMISSIIREKE